MGGLNINFDSPRRAKEAGRRRGPIWAGVLGATVVLLLALGWLAGEPGIDTRPAATAAQVPTISQAEAVEAARLFESLFSLAGQAVSLDSSAYLAMIDVSTSDGHLIVHWKDGFAGSPLESRMGLEQETARIWREAKWVKTQGWSGDVNFVQHRTGREPITRWVRK